MRTHIWKQLKTRSQTIQRALDRYNELALKMDPPASRVSWQALMEMAFTSDFETLRRGRTEETLAGKPWLESGNRAAANLFHKIERAREEMERIYVEAPRLRTWLHVEDVVFTDAISATRGRGDLYLSRHIREQYMARYAINQRLHAGLDKLEARKDYGGTRRTGQPFGWSKEKTEHYLGAGDPEIPIAADFLSAVGTASFEDDDPLEHDETAQEALVELSDAMRRVALVDMDLGTA